MACMVCGHESLRRLHKLKGYTIATCEVCDLTQLDPLPSAETLSALYGDAYYETEKESPGYDDYAGQRLEYAETFAAEVRRLSSLVPAGGRVLDVGCGFGYFVAEATRGGFDAYGLDVSPAAIDRACEVAKGRVFVGRLGDVHELPHERFDVIFTSHTLEHIVAPVEFMRSIRDHLQPGGYVVALTPNIGSFLARISGRRWVSFKLPEHVSYFRPASARYLCRETGFETVRVEATRQCYRFDFVAKRLRTLLDPMSRLVPRVEAWKPLGEKLVWISNGSLRLTARKA